MSRIPAGEPSHMLFFEDVLPKTGWGLYYKFMLGMACLCSFTQATALLCIPFAVPMSTCESYITIGVIYALHTSFALGRAFGGLVLICLCDIHGRKRFIYNSLITIFVSTFTAAFSYNYYVIVLAGFFLASGLECNTNTVKIHLTEILPKNKRGFYLAICDTFWTLGYLFLSLFSVFMKNPTFVEHRVIDMRLSTWRMIFAICGGLNIILACSSALLEESPRYFLHVKKNYLAVLALKQFYAINKSSYGESFEAKESDIAHMVADYGVAYLPENNGHLNALKRILKYMSKSIKLLFSKQFIKSVLILTAIKTPLLVLGPLEVNILLAKDLSSLTAREGVDLIYLDKTKNESMCLGTVDSSNLYSNFFVLAGNMILGQLIVMWCIDRLGRKACLVSELILSGATFITLFYIKTSIMTKIILSSILMVSFSGALSTVSVINIEAFPTALRGTSHGIVNFLGILLSIFVVRFYHLFAPWFYLIMGGLFLGTSTAAFFINDLKKQPMIE